MTVKYEMAFMKRIKIITFLLLNDLSNGAKQVYLGYKIWKYFELSLVEEFPPMDTTPDVSFNLKIKLGPRSLPGNS